MPQRNTIWWNGCKQRDERFPLVLIWVDHSLTRFSFVESMSRLLDSVSTAMHENVRKKRESLTQPNYVRLRNYFIVSGLVSFRLVDFLWSDKTSSTCEYDYVRDSCSSEAHTNRFEKRRNWFTSIYQNDFPSHWPFPAGIMCLLR